MRAVRFIIVAGLMGCGSSWQPALDDDWDALFPVNVQHWRDCDGDGWGDPDSGVYCSNAADSDRGDGCALVENDYDCDDSSGGGASGADLFGQGCSSDYDGPMTDLFGATIEADAEHLNLSEGQTEFLYYDALLEPYAATALCESWGSVGGATRSHPVAGLASSEAPPALERGGFLPDSPLRVVNLIGEDQVLWMSATFDDNDVLRWREAAVVSSCDTDPDDNPDTPPPADCTGDGLMVDEAGIAYAVSSPPAVGFGYCPPERLPAGRFVYEVEGATGPIPFDFRLANDPVDGFAAGIVPFEDRTPSLTDFNPVPESFVDPEVPDGYDPAEFVADMLIPVLLNNDDSTCIVHPQVFCAPTAVDPTTPGSGVAPNPYCSTEADVRLPTLCQRAWVEPEARIHATRRLDVCPDDALVPDASN